MELTVQTIDDLSHDWVAYLSGLSKSQRKRCRRWQRDYFDTGRAAIVHRTALDFEIGWQRLVELNEQRRQAIGDRSAFANEGFRNFHASILPQLLKDGRAELRELHLGGVCCAVEYILVQDNTLFCYQSGMLTSEAGDGYGNLSLLALFQSAIERGITRIDFLRGDESYKSHWGAVPQVCHHHFVVTKTLQGVAQSTLVRTADWMRTAKASLVGATHAFDLE
jgi:CelD/BcsL family acetyltransferase involved in cellulose biosynthesis